MARLRSLSDALGRLVRPERHMVLRLLESRDLSVTDFLALTDGAPIGDHPASVRRERQKPFGPPACEQLPDTPGH